MNNYRQEFDNELYHFGVLGMKWGKRKARSTAQDSPGIRSNKKLYSKTESYAAKQSVGKRAVKTILMGPAGKTTYDMARSLGYSRGKSAVKAIFDINVNTLGSGLIGSVAGNAVTKITGNRTLGKNVSTAANVTSQYAIDKAFKESGRAASLQQRSMMERYRRGK